MSEHEVGVALAFDDNYALPALTLLTSMKLNGTDISRFQLHLYRCDFQSREDAADLTRAVSRLGFDFTEHDIAIEESTRGLLTRLTSAVYGRLYLFEQDLGHELLTYLDVDTFCRAPIDDLLFLGSDESEHDLWACQDPIAQWWETGPSLPGYPIEYQDDDPHPTPYFNSGVMRFNYREWINKGHAKAVRKWGQDNWQYLLYEDQDALNAVFRRQWGRLDPKWNAFAVSQLPNTELAKVNQLDVARARHLEEIAPLVHFPGPDKPWKNTCQPCKSVAEYQLVLADTLRLLPPDSNLRSSQNVFGPDLLRAMV